MRRVQGETTARFFSPPQPHVAWGARARSFFFRRIPEEPSRLRADSATIQLLRGAVHEHLVGNDLTDVWIAAAVRVLPSHLVAFDRRLERLLSRNEATLLEPQLKQAGRPNCRSE